MKRLLSIAAAAAIAASPAFAQNGPAAGSRTGGGVAVDLVDVGGPVIPTEVLLAGAGVILVFLIAGSGGGSGGGDTLPPLETITPP